MSPQPDLFEWLAAINPPFFVGTLLFSLLPGVGFYLLGFATLRHPAFCRALPRHRGLGVGLAMLCLAWASVHVALMLEGGMAEYRPLLWVLVPVVSTFAFFFLDFLFARALGGLLLLAATWLLHSAFSAYLPMRPVFSVFAYLVAGFGALLVAMPWLLRDLLERARNDQAWRRCAAALCALFAAVFLLFALAALG